MNSLKLLTVNHHVAYLYLLAKTGHRIYVLNGWDESNRPIPKNCELISWEEAKEKIREVDVVIGHHIMVDVRRLLPECFRLKKPYIQVIHGRLARTGYTRSALKRWAKRAYATLVLRFFEKSGLVRFVFISDYDKHDWPMDGEVIDPGIPVEEMYDYRGNKISLLVVGNALNREHFDFQTLLKLKEELPVKIVGITQGLRESQPARNWDELRTYYSECRAFLNLTKEPEKGYNLATLEAMATGMPVISLDHPFTVVKDGWNGYLVKGFEEMVQKSYLLLTDIDLARRLGENARRTIEERFHINTFVQRWNQVLAATLSEEQR